MSGKHVPPFIRRELAEAVRRGDRQKAKRLTARAVQLQMALHARVDVPPAGTTTEAVPFNDSLEF